MPLAGTSRTPDVLASVRDSRQLSGGAFMLDLPPRRGLSWCPRCWIGHQKMDPWSIETRWSDIMVSLAVKETGKAIRLDTTRPRDIAERVGALDWSAIAAGLDTHGCA